jgi:hypothetical protein
MQLPNLTCFMCLGKATIVIVTARFIQAASNARRNRGKYEFQQLTNSSTRMVSDNA